MYVEKRQAVIKSRGEHLGGLFDAVPVEHTFGLWGLVFRGHHIMVGEESRASELGGLLRCSFFCFL
jgi:hypothetical protein